ncbi:MAG TPA: lectin like domain-containing protein [Planctomycetota bacterium]|nr:lectin like domain-containing protein [Planctomycetota bacterium]HUV38077.1 lectin like domain-containing protein [Planctomycetota bacterium]
MKRTIGCIALVLCVSLWTSVLGDSYDLRDDGYMTPVKNQGACGSCWCFGSMASIESSLLMHGGWQEGGWPDLSENHLNHWHGFDNIPACQGGDYRMVAAYLGRGRGPVRESDDPYPPNGTPAGDLDQPVCYTVKTIEWHTLTDTALGGIDVIKDVIQDCGAIGTSIYYSGSFYSGGNFYQPQSDTYDPNHSVCIAGWDDDHVVSGAPGNGAWLAKNSWGSTWNGDGYFWISYYDKHACRNPEMGAVSFHDVVADNYAGIYNYDLHGWCKEKTVSYALNRFTAGRAETLTEVAFYATDDDVDYIVGVYSGLDADNELTGLLASTSGTIAFTGYHTLVLDDPVTLDAGDNFLIMVHLSNGEHAIDATIEKTVLMGGPDPLVVSDANPGESWFSLDGTTWKDLYDDGDTSANFCIKGFTEVPEPTTVTLLVMGLAGLVACRRRRR